MSDLIVRHFLGWDGPALPVAATWLLDHAAGADDAADLSELVVVLPGSRASRVLVGLLVDAAEERRVALTPPITITPGELPVTLLGPAGAPAPALARRMAWISALRTMDADALAPLIPDALSDSDLLDWSRIAATLERVSDELAGQGLRFSQVEGCAGAMLPIEEAGRWRVLGVVQDRAERLLIERGFVDEALATRARALDADEGAAPFARSRDVVLIGAAEMNHVERAALAQGAATVAALVFAPELFADRFDELGCVRSSMWASATVDIDEERVVFVDDPREQAQRALALLAAQGEPVDVDDVVIGVADPNEAPRLRREAAVNAGVTLRAAQRDPVSRTGPGQLLTLLGRRLRSDSFDALIALAKHPAVAAALDACAPAQREQDQSQAQWWLAALDEIRRDHVLAHASSRPSSLSKRKAKALCFVCDSLDELLGDLTREPDAHQPLGAWADSLADALRSIYANRQLQPDVDADRRAIAALDAIGRTIEELAAAAPRSDDRVTCSAWQAIALVEEQLASQFIPEPPRRDAIETLGWLELAMDPAKRCVVVGMAEARVPGSVTHDPLLPNTLRKRLGLTTNETRLARDVYLLALINASRDAVFITSRRDESSDPLTPSRLLFRCTGAALAARVRRFAEPEVDEPAPVALASRVQVGEVDQFHAPLVIGPDYEPPASMRVTDFGAYLRSPAGWYLERHLGLIEHDEPPRELTAMLFGSLAHAALEAFGRDATARDLDDPAKIADALSAMLDDAARKLLGAHPPAAVQIQKALLRSRLEHFAQMQAIRRREGWRIAHVEWNPRSVDAKPAIMMGDAPMGLRGKIDRIDIHEEDGRWAIIDYKTGASAQDAARAHRKRDGQWISLQLPLYRHLVASLQPPENHDDITLGYAGLPSKQGGQVWSFAQWSSDDLAAADETACDIVRCIRAYHPGDVVEPGSDPPGAGVMGFLTGERFEAGDWAGARDQTPGEAT